MRISQQIFDTIKNLQSQWLHRRLSRLRTMKSPSKHHPFGLQYLLLLIGVWLLRLPVLFTAWRNRDKRAETLRAAGVTRSRILVRSRDGKRSIKVDVYEKADRLKAAKQYVHLNAHGYEAPFVISDLSKDQLCVKYL